MFHYKIFYWHHREDRDRESEAPIVNFVKLLLKIQEEEKERRRNVRY